MISDEKIIAEAIRLVDEGVAVTFPVNGCSMLPFIVGGEESVVLEKVDSLQVGDVVLANIQDHYVVHRIVKLRGENVWLMGDGNLQQLEFCKLQNVKAIVTHVVNANGKRRSLNAKSQKIAVWLWVRLKPVRRWLLLLYRIIKRVL